MGFYRASVETFQGLVELMKSLIKMKKIQTIEKQYVSQGKTPYYDKVII